MGGEKQCPYNPGRCPAGSPPRGRGKEEAGAPWRWLMRITPAWAGKSAAKRHRSHGKRDHPRVGGEKGLSRMWTRSTRGSPPRGRGKEAAISTARAQTGITPAWAGKSRCLAVVSCDAWDHPRVGGEKCGPVSGPQLRQGSPPRGRGKGLGFPALSSLLGITPAWAGKRRQTSGPSEGRWDHPRVGGEKRPSSQGLRALRGSPPRGRGKVIKHLVQQFHGRITPAWAGKSAEYRLNISKDRDHPRVGGEKTKKIP